MTDVPERDVDDKDWVQLDESDEADGHAWVSQDAPDEEAALLSWGTQLGVDGDAFVHDVAVTADGVVVAGALFGSVTVGDTTHTSAGGTDAFVAKLDDDGHIAWLELFGGAGNERALTVDADASRIAVGGVFEGTMSLPNGDELRSVASDDAFVLLMGADGSIGRSHAFGDAIDSDGNLVSQETQRAMAVALSEDGMVVTGSYVGSMDVAGAPLRVDGGQEGFIAKLDADGDVAWVHSMTGPGDVVPRAVVTAPGEVWVAGIFTNTMEMKLGIAALHADGGTDGFVVRLSNGNATWQQKIGGTEDQHIADLALQDERLVAVGFTRNEAVVGGHAYSGSGDLGRDALLVQLSADTGLLDDAAIFDGAGNERIESVTFADNGETLVTGTFDGELNLGSTTYDVGASATQTFVVRVGGMDPQDAFIAASGRTPHIAFVPEVGTVVASSFKSELVIDGMSMGAASFGDGFIVALH